VIANFAREKSPYLLTLLLIAGFFAGWQWLTVSGLIHRIVLPGPRVVADALGEIVQEGSFYENLWTTVREILIGFVIGAGLGIAVALLNTRFSLLRKAVSPYIVCLQAIPKVILLPLLGIWFGIGPTAATIVVALVAFFPTYLNTLTGLAVIDRDGLRLLHSLGASRRQAFRMYRIPTALPLVFTGLKTSVNYAIVAAITAEFLGSASGLGYMVTSASTFLHIPDVYAVVAVVSILAATIYFTLEILDRKLIYWRVDLTDENRHRGH